MTSLRAAIRFLTRLPCPGAATQAADLPWALMWFPLLGFFINGIIALSAWGLSSFFPLPVALILAIIVGLLITGGFHEDAISDAADGLGGGFHKQRVIEIMHDSRVGAYGVMALWATLSLRVVFLYYLLSVDPLTGALLFAFSGAWGRYSAAPLLALLPPLSDGLSKDIAVSNVRMPWLIASLWMVVVSCALWWHGCPHIGWMSLVAVVTIIVWGFYLWRRLGGQSGDLLGAGNVIVEAAVLLVAMRG
jgi:adenosylcobinamide-GDP ribazoletransferase